jgi:hypothetical protein
VRLDFDLQAFAGRVAHHVIEAGEFRAIKRSVLAVLEALPQKWQPDHAHALGSVVIDFSMRGIDIVGAENSRHMIRGTEFRPGEIYAEKKPAAVGGDGGVGHVVRTPSAV